jgi:hypothetical protein
MNWLKSHWAALTPQQQHWVQGLLAAIGSGVGSALYSYVTQGIPHDAAGWTKLISFVGTATVGVFWAYCKQYPPQKVFFAEKSTEATQPDGTTIKTQESVSATIPATTEAVASLPKQQ